MKASHETAARSSLWSLLNTPGRLGLVVIVSMLLACLGTLPWTLARSGEPGGPASPRYNQGTTSQALRSPEWSPTDAQTFWGTDALGRSLLVRCLAGGGASLSIGLLAALVSVTIGTLWGGIAAYQGGRTDAIMMRIVDVLYGLPYVLLVVLLAVASDSIVDEYISRQHARARTERLELRSQLVQSGRTLTSEQMSLELARPGREALPEVVAARTAALAIVPPRQIGDRTRMLLNLGTLLIAIGGVSWLTMARVIRGQVLSLKERPFVEAARAIGASPTRIFLRHLLPNLSGTIIVYATLTVPQAILQESFLSFLGIGVQPPMPSWGTLAADGLGELNPYKSHWWLLVFPSLLLCLTLLSLNFLGEGLRERFDPRSARTRRTALSARSEP
jgi:oligopeptide transport system permease protein